MTTKAELAIRALIDLKAQVHIVNTAFEPHNYYLGEDLNKLFSSIETFVSETIDILDVKDPE